MRTKLYLLSACFDFGPATVFRHCLCNGERDVACHCPQFQHKRVQRAQIDLHRCPLGLQPRRAHT